MADFTVAAQIKPPEFDALGTVGKLQGVQQGMLQNRLLGLQLGGKQALGDIIGQNTDPTTGETNWQGVSGAASQDPRAAILLPEIQQQVLARQLSEVQLKREQLGLTGDQWKVTGAAAMELLGRRDKDGKPAPLTADDVVATLTKDASYRGLLSDPNFVTRLAAFSQDLKDKDPDQVREALKGISVLANPTAEQIGLVYGSPSTVNTGDQQRMVQNSALTGQVNPMTLPGGADATFNQSRSPSEKAGLVSHYNPITHQPEATPSGQIVGDMAPGAVPGVTATGAKAPQTVATGPALGEAQMAESNVAQAQALQQRASIVPQRKAALSNMISTLDKFTTGPQAAKIGWLKGIASQFGVAPASIDESKAAQDEFGKLAAQIALDQWGTLGGSGSNEQLATAMKANPTETMSKLGIKNVTALLQGNEDAIGVQFNAWQKYKATHGADSYGDFLTGWNRYYDPRVFQADHMDKASRNAMLAKMSKDERAKFDRDSSVMHQMANLGQ